MNKKVTIYNNIILKNTFINNLINKNDIIEE